MPKPKIIFFDMDGVLFDVGYFEEKHGPSVSSWRVVAEKIGAVEEETALKEKWLDNKLDHYIHWVDETIKIYQGHNLKRERFEGIISSIPLMPGAKETISELKKRGYLTAVITGSFKQLAHRAKLELGIDFVMAACELLFDRDGKLVDYIAFPCDYHGKVRFFEAIIAGLGIKAEEAAMIGDGVNDIPIAKEAGFSIAFNAREELKQQCDVSIDKKDLRRVLEYFD
jgi:phosphoserine phosphatase